MHILTKAIILISAMIFLNGCLNVNLKSVLPQQTYYSLDNVALDSIESKCKNSNTIMLSINVLLPYDGKDILVQNSDNSIKILESYKWIDLPKNMIRNAFLKIGANHCIKIEQNPSVTQKLKMLKINIIDMHVSSNNNENIANIYLSYELLNNDLTKQKNDTILSNAKNENPAKALQDSMMDALEKIANNIK